MTHLLPELVICKDTEIARASSYVWVCAVQFVEVRPCERFGDVWNIEGSTICLLNEGRMCAADATFTERQSASDRRTAAATATTPQVGPGGCCCDRSVSTVKPKLLKLLSMFTMYMYAVPGQKRI